MPPKKSKAAAATSSQPVDEAQQSQRQTRAGRKRRHSDASNASDRPSSSQSMNAPSMASTPAKRRKRTRAAASVEPEVIIEEEEEIIELSQPTPARTSYEVMDEAEDSAETEVVEASSKHVHFPPGRQSQTVALNDTDEPDKSTLDSLTPHPSKLSDKRRQTASPGVDLEDTKHHKLRYTRHSLPPQLSQNGEAHVSIDELHMAPLNEVLAARMRRRLQLHKARNSDIQNLQVERRTASAKRIQVIDAEIAQIREAQRHSIELAAEDDGTLDDKMLVLESHQEAEYPELPGDSQLITGRSSLRQSFSHLLSQSTSLSASQRSRDEAWDVEREQFRSAIVSLSDQANHARTKLQILEIELNALGLADRTEDASGVDVLRSIRESFASVREQLEELLPGSLPEGASNAELVEILLANVNEFASRLRISDEELQDKAEVVASLREQVDGLLEHLAESNIQKDKTQETKNRLDIDLDNQARELEDAEAELAAREEELQVLKDNIETRTQEMEELKKDNEQQTSTVDKLSASLRAYQLEETRLAGIITTMEEHHAETVKRMNIERENTVRELEDRLDAEAQARQNTEQLAEERRTLIVSLESTKEALEQERDVLHAELDAVTADRDEQRESRETAEAHLAVVSSDNEKLEERVARADERLDELRAEIKELRQRHESERAQREITEAGLDEARDDIDKLNEQLKAKGAEANELRGKLWQVQQDHAREVKEQQELASDREQQFQADIEAEIERRQDTETKLTEANDTIEELQDRLEEVEKQMSEYIAERDEKIAGLEAENGQLLDDLEESRRSHELEQTQRVEEREKNAHAVALLNATIEEHENEITKIREEATIEGGLHSSELEDRNARIADLNHEVADLTEQIRELQSEKISLEQRVEQEAEQMLQFQTEKEDQIDALRATINDKQAKIVIVEQKAVEADKRWQELLEAREDEISELTTELSAREESSTAVTEENNTLKQYMREYVEKTSAEVATLKAQMAQMAAATDATGDGIIVDGAALLEKIEAMSSATTQVTTTTKTLHSSQSQEEKALRSARGSKKKRVIDSGIGMNEEEEMLAS